MGRDSEIFKVVERCVDGDGKTSGLMLLSNTGVTSIAGLEQISYLLGQRKILNYRGQITKDDIDIIPFNGNTVGINSLPVVKVGCSTMRAVRRYKNGRNIEGFGIVSKDGKEVYVGKDEAARLCRDGTIDNLSVQNCNGNNVFRGKGISLDDLDTVQEAKETKEGKSKEEVFYIFHQVILSVGKCYNNVKITGTGGKNELSHIWRLNKKESCGIKNISIVLNISSTVGNSIGDLELIFINGGIEEYKKVFRSVDEECSIEAENLRVRLFQSLKETTGEAFNQVSESESDIVDNKYLELVSNISNSIANKLRSQLFNGYSNGIIKSKHSNKVYPSGILSCIDLMLVDNTIIKVSLENTCKSNSFKVGGIADNKGTVYSIKKEVYQFSNQSVANCTKDIAMSLIGSGILTKYGDKESTDSIDSVYLNSKFRTSLNCIGNFILDDINGKYSVNISGMKIVGLGNDSDKLEARLRMKLSNGNIVELTMHGLKNGVQVSEISSNTGGEMALNMDKVYEFKSVGAANLTSDLIDELIRLKVISAET